MPRAAAIAAEKKVSALITLDDDEMDEKKTRKPVKKEKSHVSDDESDDFQADDDDSEEDEEDFQPSAKKRKSIKEEPDVKNGTGPRNDKNKMAFPKGVFLLCLAEQEPDDKGEPNRNKLHIWRVDNHQLLQKYERVQADDDKKYKKTNRYTGWMCEEGWKFMELKVKSKSQGEEDIVLKNYPSKQEIDLAQQRCKEKNAEDEEKDD